MNWVSGFITPLLKVVFIGGFFGFICYYVIKAFHNAWTKQWKFFWKYKIFGKSYPEKTIKWSLDCMEKGIGWHDAKKFLMVKMMPKNTINETLWIYDQVINKFNNQKGGVKNGRKFKGSYSKNERQLQELPSF